MVRVTTFRAGSFSRALGPVLPMMSLVVLQVVLLVVLAAVPARATTYYVAASGLDANSGTDTGHPWQTIAKVNASTFVAGDSILFNRGDVWYGAALTVPSSGSSGSPITFGAYGSGANPAIKGRLDGTGDFGVRAGAEYDQHDLLADRFRHVEHRQRDAQLARASLTS